jgi:hypothetical protein
MVAWLSLGMGHGNEVLSEGEIEFFCEGSVSSDDLISQHPVQNRFYWMYIDPQQPLGAVGLSPKEAQRSAPWHASNEPSRDELLLHRHLDSLLRIAQQSQAPENPQWMIPAELQDAYTRHQLMTQAGAAADSPKRWRFGLKPTFAEGSIRESVENATWLKGLDVQDVDTYLVYQHDRWAVSFGYRWTESDAETEARSGVRVSLGIRF